ncbi:striatin-3-like [Styela clava]
MFYSSMNMDADLPINGQNGSGNQDDQHVELKSGYTMPGILHFIQHEWSKFEMDRAQWEVEKAELQARIAFLQGERKGQENLKRDLVRRIKMLEFALKQERAKLHKHKFGSDGPEDDSLNESTEFKLGEEISQGNTQMSWRQGRQLLRQYLQEVGYSDTILDVRSQRVRALLGKSYEVASPGAQNKSKIVNGISEKDNNVSVNPSEADIMTNFDFLTGSLHDEMGDDDDNDSDQIDSGAGDRQKLSRIKNLVDDDDDDNDDDDEDRFPEDLECDITETDSALAEFDFLSATEGNDAVDSGLLVWQVDRNKLNAKKEKFKEEKKQSKKKGLNRPVKKDLQSMLETLQGSSDGLPPSRLSSDIDMKNEEESLPFSVGGSRNVLGEESDALRLGELAGLTVANEADPLTYDISSTKDSFRKTWTPKFTLRSHFDGVRDIAFLPVDSAVITASEDNTLKLWNLSKTLPSKKSQALDVEPIYSFRGHIGAVLSLAIDNEGAMCYSGGVDSSIRTWTIPSRHIDAYDSYVSSVTGKVLVGHTDAVWSLSYCGTRCHLLSSSADTTVRLWNPQSTDPLIRTFAAPGGSTPTSAQFICCDPSQAVVSHSDGKILIYDLETGQVPTTLAESDDSYVNCVASHPTMPISISAHNDRHIRFYDNNSGKPIHSMVAHLDAVTSLAVDPNGLYLLSGSHDCSIRLWNLDSKTCIQELTSHRKKFDESIYSVAFHPSASYIGSAGADALAKVFI